MGTVGSIIIVFAALALVAYMGLYVLTITPTFHYLKDRERLIEAKNKFNRLCQPYRLFSDDELNNWLTVNNELYKRYTQDSIGLFLHFRKRLLKRSDLYSFITHLPEIRKLQSENNLRFAILNSKNQNQSGYEDHQIIDSTNRLITQAKNDFDKFLSPNHYLTYSEETFLVNTYSCIPELIEACRQEGLEQLLLPTEIINSVLEQLKELNPLNTSPDAFQKETNSKSGEIGRVQSLGTLKRIRGISILHSSKADVAPIRKSITFEKKEHFRHSHNEAFKKTQYELYNERLKALFSGHLDNQQFDAIFTLEDNTLVVSGAGSGKTTTIVAKAHYLVDILNIPPEKILAITYTRKAADEMRTRMGIDGLECKTFHKHAKDTIGKTTGIAPSIADETSLREVFINLFEHDRLFQRNCIYYDVYSRSLMKFDHEYKTAQEAQLDKDRYKLISPYKDMNGNTKFLKSREEQLLFGYFTELGLDFLYEAPYPNPTADEEHRQYQPDFTIFYDDNVLYWEHFGIDRHGHVPIWFGDGMPGGWEKANEDYNASIAWKRNIHQHYQTQLAYSTSAQFLDGTWKDSVRCMLEKFHVPTKRMTNEDLTKKMNRNGARLRDDLVKLAEGFITLMKANEKTVDGILNAIDIFDPHRNRNYFVLKNIINPIYNNYQAKLQAAKQMDFTDCLLQAAEICRRQKPYDYEYILVDEFQDMSIDKHKFLQSLRNPHTKLFCVGDDWQSIYRFSGSDLTLFSEFDKYCGYTAECTIQATHRFANPILQISSDFVMKNPNQKRKQIIPDRDRSTELQLIHYSSPEIQRNKIANIIRLIPTDSSIYLLGRYNYDLGNVFPESQNHEYDHSTELEIEGHRVKFMSVHSAKGLEADHVFLINCSGGAYGFPSQIADDPILDYVMSKAESYPDAEERRVFYVAITRARKKTYVLYDINNPSIFIEEYFPQTSPIERCPRCIKGRKEIRYSGLLFQEPGVYIRCCCDNPGCKYTEEVQITNDSLSIYGFEDYCIIKKGCTHEEIKQAYCADRKSGRTERRYYVVPCSNDIRGEVRFLLHPKYKDTPINRFVSHNAGHLQVYYYANSQHSFAFLSAENQTNSTNWY